MGAPCKSHFPQEAAEETGWKLVHGDVFRKPRLGNRPGNLPRDLATGGFATSVKTTIVTVHTRKRQLISLGPKA